MFTQTELAVGESIHGLGERFGAWNKIGQNIEVWNEDGGKVDTEGMHKSPLLKEIPLMGADDNYRFEENGRVYEHEEVTRMLTDYITQGQCMVMAMSTIDEEAGWNGPKYVAEHVFAMDYMPHSQLINEFTAWNGPKAFALMSLPLPRDGEAETAEQRQAREVVEGCLRRSFGFKLAHGLILRVFGDTLGSLWRANEGADDVAGTYAHWLRHGTMYWCPDTLPSQQEWKVEEPIRRGPLLAG